MRFSKHYGDAGESFVEPTWHLSSLWMEKNGFCVHLVHIQYELPSRVAGWKKSGTFASALIFLVLVYIPRCLLLSFSHLVPVFQRSISPPILWLPILQISGNENPSTKDISQLAVSEFGKKHSSFVVFAISIGWAPIYKAPPNELVLGRHIRPFFKEPKVSALLPPGWLLIEMPAWIIECKVDTEFFRATIWVCRTSFESVRWRIL